MLELGRELDAVHAGERDELGAVRADVVPRSALGVLAARAGLGRGGDEVAELGRGAVDAAVEARGVAERRGLVLARLQEGLEARAERGEAQHDGDGRRRRVEEGHADPLARREPLAVERLDHAPHLRVRLGEHARAHERSAVAAPHDGREAAQRVRREVHGRRRALAQVRPHDARRREVRLARRPPQQREQARVLHEHQVLVRLVVQQEPQERVKQLRLEQRLLHRRRRRARRQRRHRRHARAHTPRIRRRRITSNTHIRNGKTSLFWLLSSVSKEKRSEKKKCEKKNKSEKANAKHEKTNKCTKSGKSRIWEKQPHLSVKRHCNSGGNVMGLKQRKKEREKFH